MEKEKNKVYLVDMKRGNESFWKKMRWLGISFIFFPIILFLIGYLLEKGGFNHIVENFEEGLGRVVQYVLFGFGVAIFFFCDGISDFFSKRFFVSVKEKFNEEEIKKNLLGYVSYTVVMMTILDMIGIFGFIGFLICGNLTWLFVFVLLNFSIQFKYLPSPFRLQFLISQSERK